MTGMTISHYILAVSRGICLLCLVLGICLLAACSSTTQQVQEITFEDPDEIIHDPMRRSYLEAESIRKEAFAIDLGSGSDEIRDNFAEKGDLIARALSLYENIALKGSPNLATMALLRIGELYQHLGETLMSSSTPSELTQEQAELYREEVLKKAKIVFRKARSAYTNCIERSNSYSDFQSIAQACAAKMNLVEKKIYEQPPETMSVQ